MSHHANLTPAERKARPSWQVEASDKEGEVKRFFGLPDRWYDKPLWRCNNGHIMHSYIKSEIIGAYCPECGESVWLTFPEDKES